MGEYCTIFDVQANTPVRFCIVVTHLSVIKGKLGKLPDGGSTTDIKGVFFPSCFFKDDFFLLKLFRLRVLFTTNKLANQKTTVVYAVSWGMT